MLLAAACLALLQLPTRAAATVLLKRTPDAGIQPQAVMEESGTLHLIYFKGDPAGGDVFDVRRPAGMKDFSNPVRVNTRPGSAIAMGNVRGPQLAIGRNSRVHVAWMGGGRPPAQDRGPGDSADALHATRRIRREV